MSLETSRWDVADFLDNREAMVAYLEAVLEDGDPSLIAAALDDVVRGQKRVTVTDYPDYPVAPIIPQSGGG